MKLTKGPLKAIIGGAAFLVCGVTALSTFVPSYRAYKEYYDAKMEEKRLNSLPLELLSIEANQIKDIYATGFDLPEKDDFEVKANFTEKGKEFSKILPSSDFSITYGDDFSDNGGDITFTYEYTPEAKGEEEVETVVKTFTYNCALTPIAIESLKLLENPYRVYYSDTMAFDIEGIKVEAKYNYGETFIVPNSKLEFSKETLTVGTESVKVGYTLDGKTVELDVPVTVVAQANYVEGNIRALTVEEEPLASNGQLLSTVKPVIRATYVSGNRLIINNSNLKVVGNVEYASFNKNCVITVSVISQPSVFVKTGVAVGLKVEAEDTTIVGGNVATKEVFEYKNEEYVKVDTTTVVDSANSLSTLSFTIDSSVYTKGQMYIDVVNNSAQFNLGEVLTLNLNGRKVYTSKLNLVSAKPNISGVMVNRYKLPDLVLKDGNNDIVAQFSGIYGKDFGVDSFTFQTKTDAKFFTSIDDYFLRSKTEEVADLTVTKVRDYEGIAGGTYIHGICTDGSFVYAARTTWSSTVRKIVVSKHNITTGEIVAVSPSTPEAKTSETYAGISVKDGRVIIYCDDGTEMSIDASLTGSWSEYNGYNFKGLENVPLKDVYYSSLRGTYAVYSGNTIYVYGEDMELISSFAVQGVRGLISRRMSATNNNIYVVFTTDGQMSPVVAIYDWDGTYYGTKEVTYPLEVAGPSIQDTTKTNVQGMVAFNENIYFSVLKFSSDNGGDSAAIINCSLPEIEENLTFKLTTGEYVETCQNNSVTPVVTAAPTYGTIGSVEGTTTYAMGGAYDGKYMYYSINGGANLTTVVYCADPATGKVINSSPSFTVSEDDKVGDNSRIFIKDGEIYVVTGDGTLKSALTSSFLGSNKPAFTDSELQFKDRIEGVVKDVKWNEDISKYIVLTKQSKMYIFNEDLTVDKGPIDVNISILPSSIACDDKYIYTHGTQNNLTSVPVYVYDWDGNYVTTFNITDLSLGYNSSKDANVNFNLQALFSVDNKLHAILCSWDSGYQGIHDFTVEIDQSVLGL